MNQGGTRNQRERAMRDEAYRLLRGREYLAAAELFTQIAYLGELRNRAVVPESYLRAGQAYLQAGNTVEGMARLQAGVEFVHGVADHPPLLEYGRAILRVLRRLGQDAQALEVAGWLERALETPGLALRLIQELPETTANEDDWEASGLDAL